MAKLKERVARSPLDLKVFKKFPYESDWKFRQSFSAMSEHAAETGELLYIAHKIDPKSRDSWVKVWSEWGNKMEKFGDDCLKKGHKISARDNYIKAWNYFSNAEYGSLPSEPRFQKNWEKSVECMHKTVPLQEGVLEVIKIPFEDGYLPGYFWRPDESGNKRPTLICVGGNESNGEQILLTSGPAAIRHEYNYFTFEYPGHRGAVHLNPNFVKRPDQQVPFKTAIDFLEKLPGVDERIALTGMSWGGYVTTKVAAYEKRLKAIIPNTPMIDWWAVFDAYIGNKINLLPKVLFNKLVNWKVSKSPVKESLFQYGWWALGWDHENLKMTDWYEKGIQDWKITDEELKNITCPALGLIGENEGKVLVDQGNHFLKTISSKNKQLYKFTLEKDGTSDHCQIDNRGRGNQIMFDWLDDLFDYRYEPAPPSS
ncbi:MAG: alpha/beta hydrolase family protein [Methanosarcinales archaeon]